MLCKTQRMSLNRQKKKKQMMEWKSKGVTKRVSRTEVDYSILDLFLDKNGYSESEGIGNIMEFGMLNTYFPNWKSKFRGTNANAKRVIPL